MNPHPHAVVIKAWADGAEIQWRERHNGSEWKSFNNKALPNWHATDCDFRVKPPPEVVRFRVALMRHITPGTGYFTGTANAQGSHEALMADSNFVRWLTDWQEVEAP